jgi:hypothetical protein
VSAALAASPWLHTRFAILAAALGLLVCWRLVAARGPDPGGRWRRVATFLIVPAISAGVWFGFFYSIYGTLSPLAPYGSDPRDRSWRFVPGGVMALLLDGQYGLLVYAPVLAVAIAGARARVRAILVAALMYLAVVGIYWMWWGGLPATPARFATAMLPLLAAPLALAWDRSDRTAREMWGLWLVLSIAIAAAVVAVGGGDLAWNYRDAQPRWLEWLGPVVNLARAWPSFFWRLSVPAAFQPDLASEWPFVIHAAGVTLTLVGAAFLGLTLARRRGWTPTPVAAWSVALGLMLAVQVGWMLTGSTGLDPARSQGEWLRRTIAGRPALAIGPGHVHRGGDLAAGLRIRAEEAGLYGKAPWGVFAELPPGRYEFRFFMQRPAAGVARVRLGRATPFATLTVAALSQQAMVLDVPAGNVLVVESDDDVRALGGTLELRRLPGN